MPTNCSTLYIKNLINSTNFYIDNYLFKLFYILICNAEFVWKKIKGKGEDRYSSFDKFLFQNLWIMCSLVKYLPPIF